MHYSGNRFCRLVTSDELFRICANKGNNALAEKLMVSIRMQIWNTLAVILCLTALFGYLNERFLKLPAAIGIMFLALMSSLILVVMQQAGVDLGVT